MALSTGGRVLGLLLFNCDLKILFIHVKITREMLFAYEKYAIESVSLLKRNTLYLTPRVSIQRYGWPYNGTLRPGPYIIRNVRFFKTPEGLISDKRPGPFMRGNTVPHFRLSLMNFVTIRWFWVVVGVYDQVVFLHLYRKSP